MNRLSSKVRGRPRSLAWWGCKTARVIAPAYEDSAQDEDMLVWHNDAMARIDPYSLGGSYVGDSNLFVHPMAILDPDSAARLEELRGKYDPDGRFDSYPSELPPARL